MSLYLKNVHLQRIQWFKAVICVKCKNFIYFNKIMKFYIFCLFLKISNENPNFVQNIPLDHFSIIAGDPIYPLNHKIKYMSRQLFDTVHKNH
jgi:hypothetical protein